MTAIIVVTMSNTLNSIKSIFTLIIISILSFTSVSYSQAAQVIPCGKYQASKSTHRLFFKNNNKVAFLSPDTVIEKNYIIEKNTIKVQGGVKIKIKNATTLLATDSHNFSDTYNQKQKPSVQCDSNVKLDPYCFTKARQFRLHGKIKAASEAYSKCCTAGDGVSCNANATLQQLTFKNNKLATFYYHEACDLGFAGGCANLAIIAMGNSDKKQAIKFYKIACNLNDDDSCSQMFKLNQQAK